jgi:ABC-type branched-subunit amino acid transport system substrate-binding protein
MSQFELETSLNKPSWISFVAAALAAYSMVPCYAQGGDPIIIGQTYIASGPVAGFSAEPLLGIKALIASVNRSGGIRGRPLALKQLDDANSPDKSEANVRELAAEGAVAILMPIGTLPAMGAMKAAADLKIPVVGPYTGAGPVYASDSGMVFPLRISFAEEARRIVNHTALIGQTRIAAVHIDNPGAKVPVDAARKALQERGSNLLGDVTIAQDGSDAAAKAKQLAALNPQGVILSASNAAAAAFIKAFHATGANAQFYATSFLNGTQLHKDLGGGANGVVIMQVVPSPRAPMRLAAEYRAAMEGVGAGNALSYPSFEGYIAARTLVDALRKTPPLQVKPAAVLASLHAMQSHDLGGLAISFKNPANGALNFGELSMIGRGGTFVH